MSKKKIVPSKNKSEKKSQKQEHSYPSWRFSTIDKAGPFPWPSNTNTELEIIQKLRNFDSMTWHEISGKEHHSISLDDLSITAQDRLAKIGKDDIEKLFSFRLEGKARVFCIRVGDVAELLWFDPEHQVCPSLKKHT